MSFTTSILYNSSTRTLQHASDYGSKTTLDIDYTLPLTTTIKRMRNAGFVYNVMGDSLIAPSSCLGLDARDVDEVNVEQGKMFDDGIKAAEYNILLVSFCPLVETHW